MKKVSYFLTVFVVTAIIMSFYYIFLSFDKSSTADHATLSLQPYTTREQQDLIVSQEQSEKALSSGPLVQQMSATDAQTKVLNLPQIAQQSTN